MSAPTDRIRALAAEIAAVADDVDRQATPGDAMEPHPDTLDLLQRRGTTRSQIHPNVPDALALGDRLRAAARDMKLNQGDAAAVALDTWLRAAGYPPPTATT